MKQVNLCIIILLFLFSWQFCKTPLERLPVEKVEIKKLWVDATSLRVRHKPNIRSKIVGVLYSGAIVAVLLETRDTQIIYRKKGKWVFVKSVKLSGWVFDYYLSSQEPRPRNMGLFFTAELGEKPFCKNTRNTLQCATMIERRRKKKYYGKFYYRKGNRLQIKLSNGKIDEYVSKEGNNFASTQVYRFLRHLHGTNFVLLYRQFFEGNDYILINTQSGFSKYLGAIPFASPDQTYLVESYIPGPYGFPSHRGLRVWKILSDRLELVYYNDYSSIDIQLSKEVLQKYPLWVDTKTVQFMRNGFVSKSKLVNGKDDWQLMWK
ncbi:MAG: SH3 domain-containing protein [Spirochaetota bacterium]